MIRIGDVAVGEAFVYNGGLFVVMPFDWENETYPNLCIATRNHDDYDVGEPYGFNPMTEVKDVPLAKLKDFIQRVDN